MKRYFLLLAFLYGHLALSAQSCLPGGIIFTSQAQIDAFPINYPGCTQIVGNVQIVDPVVGSITNLNGLSSITSIGGNLEIYQNISLTDITGLSSLIAVGGKFIFHQNPMMISLAGLFSLQTIGSITHITLNNSLTSLNGLNSLNTSGELVIGSNPILGSLSDLKNLQLTGGLFLTDNPGLYDLTGLENLTTITGGGLGFAIQRNHALQSLQGLNSLTSIGGIGIQILDNNGLQNVGGLESLQSIDGQLVFYNNSMLSDLTALSGLTSIGADIYVGYNVALTTLSGLDNINPNSITDLWIEESPLLALCNVSSVCNYLADPSNSAVITNNAPGCGTREEVLAVCFPDEDGDGVIDIEDNCVDASNPNQADSDCDLVGDVCDVCPGADDLTDTDQDGLPDCIDWDGLDNIPLSWRCGHNLQKVLVCHKPPGNANNRQTICIDQSSVASHIAHGDYLGPCGSSGCEGDNGFIAPPLPHPVQVEMQLEIMPNPATEEFRLVFGELIPAQSNVGVYDIMGRIVFTAILPIGNLSYSISTTNFLPGIYTIMVTSSEKTIGVKRLVIR